VVIGKKALYVSREDALDFVAGYVLHNDYSERSFQLERGGQWVKGKSADTFAPLGPFLATPDEISDVGRLAMWLKVNSETRQNSSRANMIFDVATLVGYVSQFMTLLPGDVISTGTPAGVGLGMNPPRYLKAGAAAVQRRCDGEVPSRIDRKTLREVVDAQVVDHVRRGCLQVDDGPSRRRRRAHQRSPGSR